MKFVKKIVSIALVMVMLIGTAFVANVGVDIKAKAVASTSIWSGSAAESFASGDGTQGNPYIIETADQLYRALSLITGTTSGVHSNESKEVAGGYQSGTIFKQSSTTDYVPVYTPYYYKVADGVKAFYLNDIVGNETLAGIKDLVASSNKN